MRNHIQEMQLESIVAFTVRVLEIRASHLAGYLSEKVYQLLNQNKRSKNQLWVWCHCNLCTLSGLCLFCNSNRLKLRFPDIFDELLFLHVSSLSPKSISLSHHRTNTHHVGALNLPNQISLKSILNPGQD